ncbi:sirohydrochlorin cobaltochelatase [candidate division KSB3 bacterium]|uniref:Sirohydrochlorin cobaltochelatase n=1 Tax=candidate division KSB3 bacterium TaxID=2044937 RepID=A0A2G6E713_9BACT|nr:MAG: sirohydrochlorin cobaltochelatase [candidate division KSB3 bacterium]PIE30304.1 MAG: sirohydrochlorin cobaltochelatase [candidate division KSB3 bacterium]
MILPEVKKTILVVSFGTSYADTRKATIDAIEGNIAETFLDYEVQRAFTSRIIRKILKERDEIEVDDPQQALTALKNKGVSEVIIQATHVIPGAEFHDLLRTARHFKDDFEKIVVGMPLLSATERDLRKAAAALTRQMPALKKDEAVVLMGHGTYHAANAIYAELERVFKEMDTDNVLVGTLEGVPTLDDVIRKLKASPVRKVILMPLLFVAGDHAQNDMAGDEEDSWKTILTTEGFDVECYLHGMGENPAIQSLYIQHIRDAIKGGCRAHLH